MPSLFLQFFYYLYNLVFANSFDYSRSDIYLSNQKRRVIYLHDKRIQHVFAKRNISKYLNASVISFPIDYSVDIAQNATTLYTVILNDKVTLLCYGDGALIATHCYKSYATGIEKIISIDTKWSIPTPLPKDYLLLNQYNKLPILTRLYHKLWKKTMVFYDNPFLRHIYNQSTMSMPNTYVCVATKETSNYPRHSLFCMCKNHMIYINYDLWHILNTSVLWETLAGYL